MVSEFRPLGTAMQISLFHGLRGNLTSVQEILSLGKMAV